VSRCQVISVRGSVHRENGGELARGQKLEGTEWLALGDSAELVVRFGSSREFSLMGPGKFLPCRNGEEQLLVSRGQLRSARAPHLPQGAETWIATPFGWVTYADAELDMSVGIDAWITNVKQGSLFLMSVFSPSQGLPRRISGPKGRARVDGRAPIEALVVRCAQSAARARENADRVFRSTPDRLGAAAAAQLLSRRSARGDCATAAARWASLDEPARAARLGDQITRADATWSALPLRSEE
jgi:hypothetical protein